jgi:hypothetical protein
MDLAFIEYHPQRVLDAFRQGGFDALEILGQADERDFFERCFKERLLLHLAQDMPTLRKKEEVPRWFILAANLSLKLHQENSLMWFDEHNHPVEYEKLTPEQRQRVRRERCYKWISLLHLRGGCYVYAGALAPQGTWQRRPEPAPSVPQIPPQRPELIRRREAKRQKKLAQLRAQQPPPSPADVRTHTEFCAPNDFTSWTAATVPIHVVLLRDHYADGHHDYTLRQWQLWKFVEETLANLTPGSLVQQLNRRQQWVVIYLGYAYTQMPLVTFTREVIQLEAPARDKALKKIQALEQNLLTLPPNPRPV